jgi:two-component system, chemotaxis family, chemotaxis protein CheY
MTAGPAESLRKGYRILVIDDSTLMNSYYSHVFGALPDWSVAFAINGRDAIAQIAATGHPDVIVLDVNMPVMNGLEFLDEFRATWPESRSRIVIVSTEGEEQDRRRGLEAGAHEYLAKPFGTETLLKLVGPQASG